MNVTLEFDSDDEEQVDTAKAILDRISDTLYGHDSPSDEQDPADPDDNKSADAPADAADADDIDATLRHGTWAYKMASTLLHTEDKWLTANEVSDALDGTEWRRDYPRNSGRDLKRLVDDDIAERRLIDPDHGHDYYDYRLTDAGRQFVKEIEDSDGVTTYRDVANSGIGALFNGTETGDA